MSLLDTPADLVRLIMGADFGETDPAAFGLSWQETKALQQAAGLKWAIRWNGGKFSEFQKLASLQGHADLMQEGGLWEYVWRGRGTPVAVFEDVIEGPSFGVTPPLTALTTRLRVSWDADYVRGTYRQSQELLSDQAARLGDREGRTTDYQDEPQTLDLPFVRDPDTALRLGRDRLRLLDRQRLTGTLTATWAALPVQKGDVIVIRSPLLAAHNGTGDGSLWFTVRSKTYRLQADDAIELAGVAVPVSVATLTARVSLALRASYQLAAEVAIKTLALLTATLVMQRRAAPSLSAALGLVRRATVSLAATLAPVGWGGGADSLLLETGEHLLLETGDRLLKE